MVRTMYDSDRPSAIPANAQIVGVYIDGSNPWSSADVARFPNAVKVEIVRRATTNAGHVLDVEPGIVPASQMVGWVRMRRRSGADPSIYCNQMNDWQNLRNLFNSAGEPEPHWWVSRYRLINGQAPPIPDRAVALQYADPTVHGQGHFDLTSAKDYWPGVDSSPSIAVVHRGDSMLIQGSPAKFNTQALAGGGLKTNLDAVTAGADGTVFPRLLVSDELWDKLETRTSVIDSVDGRLNKIEAKVDAIHVSGVDLDLLADKVTEKLLARLNLKQAL